MKRLMIVLGILVITILATLMMKGGKETKKRPPKKAVVKQLSAQAVQPMNGEVSISYQGLIQARNRAVISSEVSGQIQSQGFRLREGVQVSTGQRLFQVDSRQAKLQESNLKAQLQTTLTRFLPEIQQQYPEQYEKWQSFFTSISNAQAGRAFQIKLPKFVEQREEILAHSMGVSSQFYAYQQQSVLVDKHSFEAPFSGSITEAKARVGSPVAPGQVLAQLVGKSVYEMNLEVPVEVVPFLKKGSSAQVKVEGHGSTFQAKIVRVAQAMDSKTQTVPVVLQIKSSKEILDGRYGEAAISASRLPSVFKLSAQSLASGDRVFFIKDGQLFDRKVEVVLRDSEYVYIAMEGFQAGEMVVNEMFQEFFRGMDVKIRGNSESIEKPQSDLINKKTTKKLGDK